MRELKKIKYFLSCVFVLLLVFSILKVTAFAESETNKFIENLSDDFKSNEEGLIACATIRLVKVLNKKLQLNLHFMQVLLQW